jgi:hypothetical protein
MRWVLFAGYMLCAMTLNAGNYKTLDFPTSELGGEKNLL